MENKNNKNSGIDRSLKLSDNWDAKRVCSICLYGDGKWDAGRKGTASDEKLPVCDKCKADGWSKDNMAPDIANDPELSDKIKIISPFI